MHSPSAYHVPVTRVSAFPLTCTAAPPICTADVLARYKTMHETLVYLSHLDHDDTEHQMLDKLRLQVGGLHGVAGLGVRWEGALAGAVVLSRAGQTFAELAVVSRVCFAESSVQAGLDCVPAAQSVFSRCHLKPAACRAALQRASPAPLPFPLPSCAAPSRRN